MKIHGTYETEDFNERDVPVIRWVFLSPYITQFLAVAILALLIEAPFITGAWCFLAIAASSAIAIIRIALIVDDTWQTTCIILFGGIVLLPVACKIFSKFFQEGFL